jgi:nucleolin
MSKSKQQATKNIDAMLSDSDSEEVVAKKPVTKAVTKKPVVSDSDSDSSEVEILKNKTKRPVESKKEEKTSALPKAKAAPKKVDSDSDDSSSEEVVKKPVAKKSPVKAVKAAPKKVDSDSDDSSSEEVVKKPVAKKSPVKAVKAAPKKVDSDSDDSSSEEVVKKPAAKSAPKKVESDSEEESDEPVVQKKPVAKAVAQESNSGCKELFVKNLSWNTDENKLGEFFGKFGEVVNVKVLYDKMTGKARGLGFVEFGTRAEAQEAIDNASSLECDGRLLQVTFSDQKPERPQNGGFGGNNNQRGGDRNFGGNQRSNYDGERHTVFVGNLGFKTTEDSVKRFFSDCGNVVGIRIAKNEEGRSKGFCHVDFDSVEGLEKAKTKAGQQLDGREVRVDASAPRQPRGDFGGRGGRGAPRGRGGFPPKQSLAIKSNPNAVMTFDDDDD